MLLDINKLKYWFLPKNKIFRDFRKDTLDWENRKKRRIFVDNNSDILLVAHLDTIHPPRIKKYGEKLGDIIFARGGDDRLGCYAAHLLSEHLKADLLLTDNEEVGKSTAEFHNCKDYNWIVNFDRTGDDVVTYDFDNEEFKQALRKYWALNIGSFSDICFLKTTACCMNLGIGYFQPHSKNSFFSIKMFRKQIEKFISFYEENKNTKYIRDYYYYDTCGIGAYDYYRGNWYLNSEDKLKTVENCEWCGLLTLTEKMKTIRSFKVCLDCEEQIVGYFNSVDKDEVKK